MVDRFIIELEPAVWYRDWAGTHRTTNINDAHIFGSAVRATKEIVKACKHRPYPDARVVAVSTVVQPIEETAHIPRETKDPPFPHAWWASLTPGQRDHYFKEERLLLAQRAREEEKARAACPYTLADLGNMPAGTKLWDSVRPSVCYLKAGDGRWTIWWTWTLPDETPAFGDFDASVMLESPVPWTATEPVLDPAGAVLEKKPEPQ